MNNKAMIRGRGALYNRKYYFVWNGFIYVRYKICNRHNINGAYIVDIAI